MIKRVNNVLHKHINLININYKYYDKILKDR